MSEVAEPRKFSDLSLAASVLWAKSGVPQGHSLLAHLIDVAAVAHVILEREPPASRAWAAQALGLPDSSVLEWVACLAGLHDFGKGVAGFQNKWPEGRHACEQAGLPFQEHTLNACEHDKGTFALLYKPLLNRHLAPCQWLNHVLQSISAHHGYNFTRGDLRSFKGLIEPPIWNEAREEVLEAFLNTVRPDGAIHCEELTQPAVQWLAGLTSVSDWIGSNTDWFTLGERHNVLADYYADARDRAHRALNAIGWKAWLPLMDQLNQPVDILLARMVGRSGLTARPLQQEGHALLADAEGPSLLLVEAPMGEGKTELAFLAHLHLQCRNGHRGLYLALPTKATGNALYNRAQIFLRAFAGANCPDMQLVHGGASSDKLQVEPTGIFGAPGDQLTAATWFTRRRRPLLAPYGVGTIDQALFATLNVKHHFVRLWGLANRVVVLDEVHAYDAYTSGLIDALLRWLRELGCSVVLMSATLPESRRRELLRAWGVCNPPELPYPRLLLADSRGCRGAHVSARDQAPLTLLTVDETVDALACCALEQIAHGGCGAVILNTVGRAQQLYQRLRESQSEDTQLVLFHARFPANQRGEREQEVLRLFSEAGHRPRRGLLVATQVAEQSLDIDFDFMITDLAPVDLVLQRAGRLHRHDRQRPVAHAEPRLWVAGLAPERLPDLKATAWQYVYQPYVLGRTWALLSREQQLKLPADIDRLVQAVYGDQTLPDDLHEDDLSFIEGEAYGQYLAMKKSHASLAHQVAIDPGLEPQDAYLDKFSGYEPGETGSGLPNDTRIGEESLSVVPVYVTDGGWCVAPAEPAFDPHSSVDHRMAQALYDRQINVSRKALVKYLSAQPRPAAFEGQALLRHLYPLPLTEGALTIGSLTIGLDIEMGLVYESTGEVTLPMPTSLLGREKLP